MCRRSAGGRSLNVSLSHVCPVVNVVLNVGSCHFYTARTVLWTLFCSTLRRTLGKLQGEYECVKKICILMPFVLGHQPHFGRTCYAM